MTPRHGLTVQGGPAPLSLVQPPAEPPRHWRAGARALRLLTVTVAAVSAALVTGHAWVLALAAGPLVLLVLATSGEGRPTVAGAGAEVSTRRCFEGEPVEVRIELAVEGTCGRIAPRPFPGPGMAVDGVEVSGTTLSLRLTPHRWGRWSLGIVDVDVYDTGGLARRTVRVELGEVQVFPMPTHSALTPIPVRLPERLGEHTARQRGEGVEVTGVRPHVWGERQRRIHWPSTTRRGSVQINQFAAERASDTVVLLDALGDYYDPSNGVSSLDETVRAAAGIAKAYLRLHDRVGVLSIGGTTRWLTPGTGGSYFHRLVETVLEVRRDLGYHLPDLDRLPRQVIPADALVYVVSTLTDHRALEVLRHLTARGNPVVVIEVPIGSPQQSGRALAGVRREAAELAVRLWEADREANRFALRARGVPVLPLVPGAGLDLTLAPLLRTRVQGARR
ncbi:DUF58 domain-containing protein [Kitasatospora sp. NPDC096147]|uniref:DUF58 domain-containing protein n=1 Tax=Kitasatospora sp. NPDC096147 TaxID=3364093 RepID=UPI0037F5CAE9